MSSPFPRTDSEKQPEYIGDIDGSIEWLSRHDRFNDWLDQWGVITLGLVACVLLAFALPHWIGVSSQTKPGGITAQPSADYPPSTQSLKGDITNGKF
jgi:hypothetical protein